MKMKKKWKPYLTAGVCGCLLLAAAALPASAADFAADITPDMTMKQVRSDPGVIETGVSTYDCTDATSALLRKAYENKTVEEYVGAEKAADAAESLNLAIKNYDLGVQVTWQVYTPEEIAADPELGMVQLFYFPAEQPNANYVLVVGGNAHIKTGEFGEALASASELHEKGYAVFVLRYRTFMDAGEDAPLQDILRAMKFIDEHTAQFNVQREDYALLGYSSGGHIVGLAASENKKYGYRQLGIPAPAAVILGYPVNDFFELKPVYSVLMDPSKPCGHYYWHTVSGEITSNYPPTYVWCGRNDGTLAGMGWNRQVPEIEKALQDAGVTHQAVYYDNAGHAVDVGRGTEAEGWIADAVAFWEEQCR